jgi:hypothetical protein
MALETDTFTGINKVPLRKGGFRGMSISLSRGDDHHQTISEDDLRGV